MKKINIGMILTILVLLTAVIYNIYIENQRKKDLPRIQNTCKEYINFVYKCIMLDKNYRTLPTNISESEYNKYLSNIKIDIEKYFIDDSNYIDNQYQIIKKILDKQAKDNFFVITFMTTNTDKIDNYIFSGDKLQIKLKVDINAKYLLNVNNTITNKAENNEVTDIIYLKKIDDSWKITSVKLESISILKNQDINDMYMFMKSY